MTSEVATALISGGTAIFTLIVGPIIIEAWKRRNNKDPLKEAIEINNLISNKLEEIKNQYNTDRTWLCQFHNGGVFYPTGKSMQKFSMIYETINTKVDPLQQQFQNIPTGLFSNLINTLEKGLTVRIPNYKESGTYGLESLAESANIQSTYIFPLITINNKLIGFVGLDFIRKNHMDEKILSQIELEISSIGGTLMNEYLNKK